jgi:hypothetical protein
VSKLLAGLAAGAVGLGLAVSAIAGPTSALAHARTAHESRTVLTSATQGRTVILDMTRGGDGHAAAQHLRAPAPGR